MKMYKNNNYLLLCLGIILFMAACKKLDLAPRDRFSQLTYWNTTSNVEAALNNTYHWLYQDGYVLFNDGLSDNAYRRGADETEISSGSFTPSNNRFKSEWDTYFSGIKACNVFLDNVDQNKTIDTVTLKQMKGEVRFIRAWLHFHLANWWGDVPILKHDITADEAKTLVREKKEDVVKFVLDELDDCITVLPKKEDYSPDERGRITKGAALAFKARVLLYEGDKMEDVAKICEELMGQQDVYGQYSLENDYASLFNDDGVNKSTNEDILSLQFVPQLRTWSELFDMVPISVGARTNGLAPTQELVDSYIMLNGKKIGDSGSGYDINNPYKNRDPRLTATVVYDNYNWINPNGSTQTIHIEPGSTPAGESSANEYSPSGQGSASGYYWRKYWDPDAADQAQLASGLNLYLIRYADVLLMYAEAKEALSQFNSDVWDETIKPLRERAGFTNSDALDYPGSNTDFKKLIRNERRDEFALEGLRIDDIRRWRIAEDVMNGYAHGARFSGDLSTDNGFIRVQKRTFDPDRDYLWPIPPTEIELDNNLTQNPNY